MMPFDKRSETIFLASPKEFSYDTILLLGGFCATARAPVVYSRTVEQKAVVLEPHAGDLA